MSMKRTRISRTCHFERGKIKFSKEIAGRNATFQAANKGKFRKFCLE